MGFYKTMIKAIVIPSIVVLSVFVCQTASRECTKQDLKYAYTECTDNTQWRVQVPKTDCQGGAIEFPKPGIKCNRTCKPGNFLEISTDSCKPCPPGHYSLGAGVRFDNWKQMPDGFEVSMETVHDEAGNSTCQKAQWRPMGGFVGGYADVGCMLNLLLTVRLATTGSVTFEYQFPSNDVFFAFDVQNERCENAPLGNEETPWLDNTERGEIGTRKVQLRAGMNVLRWTVLGTQAGASGQLSALLHSVQVTGLPFVRSCSRCPPGWHSDKGQAACKPCPRDHSSIDNGASCVACPSDEFAPPASDACKKRRPCTEADAEQFYPACSQQSAFKTRLSRRWVPPLTCLPSDTTPAPAAERSCARYCSPGMLADAAAAAAGRLVCKPCPTGQFSQDTSGKCSSCPAATQVVQEYVVANWVVVPPLMNFSCLPLRPDLRDACPGNGWNLMMDYARTASSRLFAHKVLSLKLPGFTSPVSDLFGEPEKISAVSFEFETECAADCQLMLVQRDHRDRRARVVKKWTNGQKRQNFSLDIDDKGAVSFYLVFDPTMSEDASERQKAMHDHVKVFSVRAANVKGSGGVRCRHCPMGVKDKMCIPCMPGKYYEAGNNSCVGCPPDTVVSQHFAEGRNSCHPCGRGLRSSDGVSCGVDPKPIDAEGKHFDLRPLLTDAHAASGVKMFAYQGAEYRHVYNVSLNATSPAVCVSNATKVSHTSLRSLVCRSTLVPGVGKQLSLSALATSLGDRVLNVSRGYELPQAQQLLERAGWLPDPDGFDAHVFLETAYSTSACPAGFTTVVTLRCDVAGERPKLQLPPKCPDGTCDGCLYQFLLLASHACPLCRVQEFETVRGECVLGTRTVHQYPPKHCYLSGKKPKKLTSTERCPLLSLPVLAALCTAAAVGLASMLMACHCYRQNKSLQYKYMQLVEAQEGDTPGAESCAVHEGEDDDDQEEEVKVKRGQAVFSKLRRSLLPSGQSRGRSDDQQKLGLTEQMEDLEL